MTDAAIQPLIDEIAKLNAKVDALQSTVLQPKQGYYTLAGAAAYLGWLKSDGTPNWEKVRTLTRLRRLAYSKPGKNVMIAKKDLDALMQKTRTLHPLRAGKSKKEVAA